MSLTVLGLAAVAAAAAGWFAARRRNRAERPVADAPKGDEPAKKGDTQAKSAADGKKAAAPAAAKSPFDGLPLALGDVVSADGDERWLSGALVAREGDRVVGVLFVAPEGRALHAVAAFPPPRRDIHWLAPAEVEIPAEPPATVELAGATYTRRSRLPVSLERQGQGAPELGESALWAQYEATGRDVALVLSGGGKVFAWTGTRQDPGDYDRMGGGGTD
jgi:hypothetical protein